MKHNLVLLLLALSLLMQGSKAGEIIDHGPPYGKCGVTPSAGYYQDGYFFSFIIPEGFRVKYFPFPCSEDEPGKCRCWGGIHGIILQQDGQATFHLYGKLNYEATSLSSLIEEAEADIKTHSRAGSLRVIDSRDYTMDSLPGKRIVFGYIDSETGTHMVTDVVIVPRMFSDKKGNHQILMAYRVQLDAQEKYYAQRVGVMNGILSSWRQTPFD